MRTHLDCLPCFLRQSLIALRLGTEDVSLQETVVKNTFASIQEVDFSRPPAYTTTFIHRKIRQALGKDPFKGIKSKYNKIALEMYPSLKSMLEKSKDPLWIATRLAIAGNVIDFGIFTSINIEETISRALNSPFPVDNYRIFRDSVETADEILYLTDNAGEIVFDRLLIEELISRGKKIRAVVKGSPVINDSTLADAEESGLTEICEVIDNGSDGVGTILEWTSSEFNNTFNNAQLVISKGQGNFETLSGIDKEIFFLFQSNLLAEFHGLARG
jgi:damage-control phosphatase, subfamily I